MAKLRPARCYKNKKRPNTRTSKRVAKKAYVKGVPVGKIHHFSIGNKKEDYPVSYHLISKTRATLRSNALEAARVVITKYMTSNVGQNNFFLRIRTYPHHVLRENPLATGAGADRFSSGMRRSFGKPIGVAALIKPNQKVISIYVSEENEASAKEALRRASKKLSGSYSIVAS